MNQHLRSPSLGHHAAALSMLLRRAMSSTTPSIFVPARPSRTSPLPVSPSAARLRVTDVGLSTCGALPVGCHVALTFSNGTRDPHPECGNLHSFHRTSASRLSSISPHSRRDVVSSPLSRPPGVLLWSIPPPFSVVTTTRQRDPQHSDPSLALVRARGFCFLPRASPPRRPILTPSLLTR